MCRQALNCATCGLPDCIFVVTHVGIFFMTIAILGLSIYIAANNGLTKDDLDHWIHSFASEKSVEHAGRLEQLLAARLQSIVERRVDEILLERLQRLEDQRAAAAAAPPVA